MLADSPSRAHIALALIVLKSKPPNFSVTDYVRQIRSIIIKRSRKVAVDAQHYVDGTLFWKQAYERSETEKTKLVDKIHELEQIVERSLSPATILQVDQASVSKFGNSNRANTQSKRRKIQTKQVEEDLDCYTLSMMDKLPTGHRSLLRAIHLVRSHLRREQTSKDSLRTCVRAACLEATKALEYDNRATVSTQTSEQTFKAIQVLWRSILQGSHEIENIEPESDVGCVPEMIYVFPKMLGCIQQLCLDEAERQIKLRKRTNVRPSVTSDAEEEYNKISERSCKMTATTFCQMLHALEPGHKSSVVIFEGVACAVLDYIGSSVSLLVFAEPGTRDRHQAGILPPRGLVDVEHTDHECAILTSQLAAPYLILILQQVLSVAEKLEQSVLCGPHQRRPSANKQSSTLSVKLRRRLQSTLLRGVYGDEDTTFDDALIRVEQPETTLESLHKTLDADQDRSQWFIGQVWEHLGWDILCGRMQDNSP